MNQKTRNEIMRIIDTCANVFVSSIDSDGYPNTRCMFNRMHEDHKIFYLSTNTSSLHVQQYLINSKACLYFCKENQFQGLMLKGKMEVCTDNQSREKIWKESDSQYYPNGVYDDDYCVLRFTAEQGCFYNGNDRFLFKIGHDGKEKIK